MFWIVGATEGSYYSVSKFSILDDENNVIEEYTKEQVNTYANSGIKIGYKEGSIPESKKNWVGKKTWDDYPVLCRSDNNRGNYYILREGHISDTNVLTLEKYIKQIWREMQRRCTKTRKCNDSYRKKGIYVDESFKDFDNFLNWFKGQSNLKYLKEAKLQIDKDLKGKGYYGVDSCLLLPMYLNNLISKLTSDVKRSLPLCCKSNREDWVEVRYNGITITDDMKDTFHSDEYVLSMMQEFMNDRGIKTWNYATSVIDVGRKWLTYKRMALEHFRAEAKKCYDKGWITLEAYNLCLAYDIKITD